MKKICTIAAVSLAALTLSPLPIYAQEDSAVQQQDAYSLMFEALESGVDKEGVLDITTTAIVGQILAANPNAADPDSTPPGLSDALFTALRPVLGEYSERVRLEYRPQMLAATAEVFTEDEAASMAQFYNSELGQRMLHAASSNVSVENTLEQGMAGEAVTEESINADAALTGQRTLEQMSEEDQAAVFAAAVTTPGYRKMPVFQQRIAPIRAQMESSPPTPEESAALMEAISAVMQEFAP